jgi:acyl carrier protein
MTADASLSFEAFQAVLAELLQAEVAHLRPDACLITDLGVDSLRMVEILLRLEELGLEISPDAVWEIETVADAYAYYQQRVVRSEPFGLPLGHQDRQQAAGGYGP